jgi:hypothetical protein
MSNGPGPGEHHEQARHLADFRPISGAVYGREWKCAADDGSDRVEGPPDRTIRPMGGDER